MNGFFFLKEKKKTNGEKTKIKITTNLHCYMFEKKIEKLAKITVKLKEQQGN